MKKFTSLMLMLLCAVTTWAGVTDLPEMSTEGNTKWYTIKNVRRAKYATYAGESTSMTQQSSLQDGSLFYFTGSVADGVATVKIHNAQAGDLLCAGTNSWTAEGIDWYIAAKTETGLSISKTADFSGNNSWNDFQGSGTSVDYWSATDPGSIWAIEEFGADIQAALDEMLANQTTPVMGEYKYDEEKYNALASAYATFKAEANISNYNACSAIVATLEKNMPEAGKYYVIEAPLFYNVQGVRKGLGVIDGALGWNTIDLSNKAYYWSVEINEGTFAIKNASTGTYIGGTAMSESAVYGSLTALGEEQFNIIINGTTVHANGHGSGAGASGNVVSWGGSIGTGSAWAFVETEDPDLSIAKAALQNKVDELNGIIALTGTNPGEYNATETAKLVAPIAAAEEVLNVGSAMSDTYVQALATLNSAIEGVDLSINPVVAGTYMIVSAASAFGENTKAISCYTYDTYHSAHRTPAWDPINENDPLQYWTLEDAGEGKFNIKAAYEGNYITTATSMSATAAAASFESLGSAQFKINLGGVLHCNGWNWAGAGVSGPLTTWNGVADSPSAWKLIAVEEPSFTHTLTVSDAGYATLMLAFNATIPTGVECYYATHTEGDVLKLAAVEGTLPAKTPVIVKAAAGEYAFASTDATATVDGNILNGTLYPTNVTPTGTAYVLSAPEGKVGLYQAELANGTFLNNANKVYFDAAAAGIASYSFGFDWAGTTGIEGVTAEGAQDGAIYDITGRQVKAITAPGIYIINGKKVVK